jgi:NAD(P)-dependent dehydrogenase (short-subunit alcohol dehydrogenase family)
MFDLTGKIALVTGGSKGIGLGIALALAEAGADVAINGHRDMEAGEAAADAVRALGRRSTFIAGDVSDPVAVQALVDGVVAELGGLHVAVNNAMTPIGGGGIFSDRALESWPKAIDQYLSAPFYCCRAEAKHMAEHGGGSIINISSSGAHKVPRDPLNTGLAAYCAGKAGLTQLTRVLAAGWASLGIRVNSISPGLVKSESTRYLLDDEARLAEADASLPVGRMGEAAEVGGAVVYLASDAASFTTGVDLPVDGGLTLW